MTVLGIVGAGAVGQAVATAVVTAGLADQLVVASRTREQAAAFATDIQDMSAVLRSSVTVRAAISPVELHGCDALVVAVRARFRNTHAVDVRMGGTRANAMIIHNLASGLAGYPGVVLVVTNSVDILTRLVADISGCRAYGVGSGLDTARYRAAIAAFDVRLAESMGT